MNTSKQITLSTNVELELATSRLLECCREEYDYYDGLPQGDPNRIEPFDVLATVSMNSYITNAAQARRIHRGMVTNCTMLLASLPVESNLLAHVYK